MNYFGQLGDGTTTDRAIPVEVSSITTATSIALGGSHSCALLTEGTVKCWGQNLNGQFGDGRTRGYKSLRVTPSSYMMSVLLVASRFDV